MRNATVAGIVLFQSGMHAHAHQLGQFAIVDLDPDIIGNVFPSGHTSAKILYDWWLCLLLAMGI